MTGSTVPSGQWLRDMYDDYIESHKHDLNQHMALLSAEIIALDHSHKIPKHIATVNGERVFTALLTVTNEHGEIRSCNLVATKAHSQFELALKELRNSLLLYGNTEPVLCYTDAMTDKAFLETSFPSLRNHVVPIEKYSNLDLFSLPPHVQVTVLATINAALSTIIDDLSSDESSDQEIVVGFDAEWNVDISETGAFTRGEIAVIQIAYQARVYILQISSMLVKRALPNKLTMLLSNPRIRKAGRLVSSDLRSLQDSINNSPPFVGALDLAKFAKDRLVVTDARCSLSDLCASVLGKCLQKNVSERISSAWENKELTGEQIAYAATDAYAPLLIFHELAKLSIPQKLPKLLLTLSPVLLYSSDGNRLVARGHLSEGINVISAVDYVKITAKRTLVDILEVYVPGYKLPLYNKRTLESFGLPSFSLVCLRSHLRLCDNAMTLPAVGPSLELTHNDQGGTGDSNTMAKLYSGDVELEEDLDNTYSADLLADDTDGPPPAAAAIEERNVDLESAAYGNNMLDGLRTNAENWNTPIRSRVLKDVFHVFHMLPISTTHALRNEFGRALRDAIFIPDREDRARIAAWASKLDPPTTFESIRSLRPQWLWQRCKRIIPPPEMLYPLVEEIFRVYGPLTDATTHLPLFNRQAWEKSKQILELIRLGYISDPPGISLYQRIRFDMVAGNLPVYRCSRGTNFTEGGVHTHLRSHLPSSGASIRHVNTSIADFVLHHNLRVGTYNRTSQKYKGHYSIWLTNQLQERTLYLEDVLINPSKPNSWVNGNLYILTTETIGILPVPHDVRLESGMTEHNVSVDRKQKHSYLARMQGTRCAILPVHTTDEHALFRELMKSNGEFISRNWKAAVSIWNRHADSEPRIFYKLIEQLKTYYSDWMKDLNVKQSLALTLSSRRPVNLQARDPSRSVAAPAVPERLVQHERKITHGYNTGIQRTLNQPTLPALMPDNHTVSMANPASSNPVGPATSSQNSDVLLPLSMSRASSDSRGLSPRDLADMAARKRVSDRLEASRPIKKARKPRTCSKCAQPLCPGKKSASICKASCQDCGRRDCKGQNSRRPTVPCNRAWMLDDG